ncbi:adult-specific cuticular protein ACP-20-like [Cydia pomonella]|uniref:adult-specific cuticular protein ACP-20-like n=1 Tax=Cydia pomonella TaxID=82600 RepID=UPI002ADDB7E0|nr:adult-specific cuticular protein ACP-20-like [Cydia pomonella]
MLHHVTIVCLLGAVHSAPSGGIISQGIGVEVGSVSNPSYGFNYAVSDPLTGDNKAQSEQREGGVVKGSYSLSEPDGTVRVVDYTADPVTGFNAVVKRIGPAAHPAQLAVAPAPVVSKAIIEPVVPIAPIGLKGLGLELGGLGLGLGGLGLKGGLGLEYAGLGLDVLDAGLWKH